MDKFPVEIWHLIFSLACTDDGFTGRSLSLASTHLREISAPFKYQSIAITHWSQIIAFSQLFCKLPASQKKTVALFVHHPYPFLDVDGYSKAICTDQMSDDDLESSEESEDGLALLGCNDEALDGSNRSGSDDGAWYNIDSEFEGSLDSEEEREILEDVDYLESVRDGRITSDCITRDDKLDADIQAFYNKVLQAFHAVLNEISSTLQVLAVYWNSFEPLQMHEILPVLPCLIELHINRSSLTGKDIYEEPPATVLFPRLKFLSISGDNPRKLSFGKELARVAPNLAFLRFSLSHF
jgi:hypothetical protein